MAKWTPIPVATSAPFWDGLRRREVRLQYSPSTDRWVFYPRMFAPGTLADDLEWKTVSGEATLYTYTVCRRPTAPPWAHRLPQLLAVVELREGVRLTTELTDVEPGTLRVGMALEPVFIDVPGTEVTLLHYRPSLARGAAE